MEKDTLQKIIDLYVEKELEERFIDTAQDLFNLLHMYDNCITYDKKLDAYVVSFGDYNKIKSAISILKYHLKERYNVELREEQEINNPMRQISQESLNLINGAISAYEQRLKDIKKLPEKAVFVNLEKTNLILEIENTLTMLRKIKKETEN